MYLLLSVICDEMKPVGILLLQIMKAIIICSPSKEVYPVLTIWKMSLHLRQGKST
jgi:hypothetical protein